MTDPLRSGVIYLKIIETFVEEREWRKPPAPSALLVNTCQSQLAETFDLISQSAWATLREPKGNVPSAAYFGWHSRVRLTQVERSKSSPLPSSTIVIYIFRCSTESKLKFSSSTPMCSKSGSNKPARVIKKDASYLVDIYFVHTHQIIWRCWINIMYSDFFIQSCCCFC